MATQQASSENDPQKREPLTREEIEKYFAEIEKKKGIVPGVLFLILLEIQEMKQNAQ